MLLGGDRLYEVFGGCVDPADQTLFLVADEYRVMDTPADNAVRWRKTSDSHGLVPLHAGISLRLLQWFSFEERSQIMLTLV